MSLLFLVLVLEKVEYKKNQPIRMLTNKNEDWIHINIQSGYWTTGLQALRHHVFDIQKMFDPVI